MQQQVGQGRVQWSRHPQPDMLHLSSPCLPPPLLYPFPPPRFCTPTFPTASPSQIANKCGDFYQLIRSQPNEAWRTFAMLQVGVP